MVSDKPNNLLTIAAYFEYAREALETFRADQLSMKRFFVPPVIPDVTSGGFTSEWIGKGLYTPDKYIADPGVELPALTVVISSTGMRYTKQFKNFLLVIEVFDLTLYDGFAMIIVVNAQALFSNIRRTTTQKALPSPQQVDSETLSGTAATVRKLLSNYFVMRGRVQQFTESEVFDMSISASGQLAGSGNSMRGSLREGLVELSDHEYVREIGPGEWTPTLRLEQWFNRNYRSRP